MLVLHTVSIHIFTKRRCVSVNCRNDHMDEAKCNKWALEGECQINPDWMISNCRKSCRSCVETKVPDKEDKDVEPDDGNFIRLLQ